MSEFAVDNESLVRKELLTKAIISGLIATYKLHQKLGDSGRTDFRQNQFGETALRMDVEAEDEILSAIKKTQMAMEVFSEEHGQFNTGDQPKYIITIDGLDGSAEYKAKRGKAMYGTMVSVLNGINPTYDDYLISGIMIHSPKPQLLLAIKNKGCFSVDIKTGERRLLKKQQGNEFSEESILDLDTNWEPYRKIFAENKKSFPNLQCAFLSEAARTALFVNGKIEIGLEWTRKQNLEQPPTYGLVKELGGAMTTADGRSLGAQFFKTFEPQNHIPLIVAPSQEIAVRVSQRFGLQNLRTQSN